MELLQKANLPERVIIDCSHGNSGKDPAKQPEVFEAVLKQKNPAIRGIMLESYLEGGKQAIPVDLTGFDKKRLKKRSSVTDGCLGWDETEKLLLNP